MAELLQPPDIPILAAADPPPPISPTATSSASPPPPPPPLPPPPPPPPPIEIPATTTISNPSNPGPSLAPKRQRRPSVRLGEIGHQSSFDHSHSHSHSHSLSHSRRPKSWRFHKDPSLAAKTSKTRPLTNLVNGANSFHLHNDEDSPNYNLDFVGTKKTNKTKKPTKRPRTNWAAAAAARFDANGAGIVENDNVFRDENHDNYEHRDFKAEGSDESPIKEQSPVHSMDNQNNNNNNNMGLQFWDRRAGVKARLSHSESLDRHENHLNFDTAMNGIHNEMNSGDDNTSSRVRDWLIGLGLGRYAPVFEIHEVDDEVLPMLTLEDLKDMGINAVGSRRKMYSAILKLRKGFS